MGPGYAATLLPASIGLMLVMHLIRSQDHLRRKWIIHHFRPLSSFRPQNDPGARKESGILWEIEINVIATNEILTSMSGSVLSKFWQLHREQFLVVCAWLPRTTTSDQNGTCGKMQNMQAWTCFLSATTTRYSLKPLVWF